jgi:hypothetical protein
VSPILDGNQTDADSNTAGEEVASRLLNRQQSIHPPPAFGSSTNLEALALEASKSQGQDHDSTSDNVNYRLVAAAGTFVTLFNLSNTTYSS